MNDRIHAVKVISKRRIHETLASPGYYAAMATGLTLACVLISGFVHAIDSSGFNYQLNPVYDLLGRSMEGVFGSVVMEKLFAEGPFQFILYVACIPTLLYLSAGTVFRFGLERKVGALELITYGPADGTSCFLAFLVKDVFATLLYIAVLAIFMLISALMNNLLLGPVFSSSLVFLFLASIVVYAYAILASTLTDNSASAIAVFLAIVVFFLIVFLGSFQIVSSYIRGLTNIIAWTVNWISPLFYWRQAARALETGRLAIILLNVGGLLVLAGAVLTSSHFILKARGIRP